MPFVKWLLGGFHFSRGFLIMENLKQKWFISKQPKGIFGSIEISCYDYRICETITADEEDLKNAKLIAAAPELLETLIEVYNDSESWSNLFESTKNRITNAINKATK